MKKNSINLVFILTLLLGVNFSFGQITLSKWDLTVNSSPNSVDINATAGNFVGGSGIGGVIFSGTGARATGWSQTTLDLNDYFEISIEPNTGLDMVINELLFGERRSGTGIHDYEVRWSKDSFATSTTIATVNVPDNTSERTGDITGLNIPVNNGETIEFRFYGYNAEGGAGTWRINNGTLELKGVFTNLPTITATPNVLTGFTYIEGNGPSAEQSFILEGTNLTAGITIGPTTNFEYSFTSGFLFTNGAITIPQFGGSVGPLTIFVRQVAGLLEVNSPFAENIDLVSTGATTVSVAVDGTVTVPTINVDTNSLTGFSYLESNGPSAEQSFTVSGTDLFVNIQVTPPTNYEISLTSGGPFQSTPISLAPIASIVPPTLIFVRLNSSLFALNNPFLEDINLTSLGANSEIVTLSGFVILKPECNITTGINIGTQDFETTPATPVLTFTQTNTAIATGNGNTPNNPKFISGTQGIEINNAAGEIIFDTVDTSTYSNITFSIHLASFSGNPGQGSDQSDMVKVFISDDNGVSYSEELRMTGFGNAKWSFISGTDTASVVYDGDNIETEFDPNDAPTDDFSILTVSNLPATSSLKIKLEINNNNLNEFWVLDDASLTGDQEDVTTWDGTNWSNLAPNLLTKTIIDGDYDMNLPTRLSITTCECEVSAGNTVTITAGEFLEVSNDITNNGTIIVNHEGSIVQHNEGSSVTGTDFQIEKTTPTYVDYDYTYWSSPTQNETIGSVFATNPSNYIFEFITANFSDTDSDTFDDDNDDWNSVNGATVMNAGVGYIAMGEGSPFPINDPVDTGTQTQSVTFDGTINNGTINVPVTLDKFNTDNSFGNPFNTNTNLVGNPYASAIDIKKLFLKNADILEGTFYFWTHDSSISNGNPGPDAYNFTNNDYATATTDGVIFNQVNGGSAGTSAPEFIASGQGFITNVDIAATLPATLTFNNSMRETGNNNNFKNSLDATVDRIWLNLTNEEGLYRQILIAFSETANDNYTKGQDGQRTESGNNSDFYSIINNDDRKFAIQTLSLFDTEKTVQLGVKAIETGLLTINIDNFQNDIENTNVYLKDNLLNTVNDLKLSDYTFDITQEGVFNNRFEIIFSKNALSIDNDIINEKNLIVSNQNETIHFEMRNGKKINSINGFDVLGKLIIQANPNNSDFNISTNINNGTILFFKVKLESGQILNKKFIKF